MSTQAADETWRAIQVLVSSAAIEFIPLKGAEEKLQTIPKGAKLTITCSVKLGLDRTIEHAERAVRSGYRVVPHLPARQVPGKAALADMLARFRDAGVKDIFVIGGDAGEQAGSFSSAAELLESLAGIDHELETIGIGCYPEGHPKISDEVLLEALLAKQPFANYMVSQLCFDPGAMVAWLERMRSAGITLPLHVGLAAPMQIHKLVELSLKIGVGTSVRYLTKQHGLVGSLIRGSSYRPEDLLVGMGASLVSSALAVEGLHVFSFNQIAQTLEWQEQVATTSRSR
ncbi:MAG: methylenetetrahydrofolate reductase [Acidimicrobiales bacterium]